MNPGSLRGQSCGSCSHRYACIAHTITYVASRRTSGHSKVILDELETCLAEADAEAKNDNTDNFDVFPPGLMTNNSMTMTKP